MKKIAVAAFITALFTLFATTSCQEQDSLFGNTFIPPAMDMGTEIDSTMSVKTSIFAFDSIDNAAYGIIYLGSINDKIMGSTYASGMTSYFASGFALDAPYKYFGKDAVIDSMSMVMHINKFGGDDNYPVNVSVHPLKDLALQYWNMYYSNFDPTGHYEEESILDFTLQGGDTTLVALLPQNFYEKFLYNDPNETNGPYNSDTTFINTFKGFYFKVNNPIPAANEEGAMYQVDLGSSTMHVYYHNFEAEPDTSQQTLYFFLDGFTSGNQFTMVEHDYTRVDPSVGGVDINQIGDSTLNLERTFIQGMAGLSTRVEFDTLFIEDIKAKARAKGYSSIGIHRAELIWKIDGRETATSVIPETLDAAPDQLGAYMNYNRLQLIADYNPILEADASQNYISSIGGIINRSLFSYEQNLTITMQLLFNKPDNITYKEQDLYTLEVTPSFFEMMNLGSVVLGGGGSSDNKPEVVLVYTLVR